ncbi:MAG: disulfide bond formation protein [Gammaproteobacteria bacterium]|jgi:hypothetical protein|nr:disulfide bond formation protein [Gammaproteobacteria bacterium]
MERSEIIDFTRLINALTLIGISCILLFAFVAQIALWELPCPLCLLQRIGLLAMAFGFLLNMHYQIRPTHYALSILAAIATGIAATRQIVIGALPPHGYGYPILGLHLYTWTALLCTATVIYTCILMCIPGQYQLTHYDRPVEAKSSVVRWVCHFAFSFLVLMLIGNVISVYLECGLMECHGDFLTYKI